MAMKLRLTERCEMCGLRQAEHLGDRIYYAHNCLYAPPGPPDPPRRYLLSEVTWVSVDDQIRELGQMRNTVSRFQERLRRVIGWREHDWPEGFDRRTAEMVAELATPAQLDVDRETETQENTGD